MAKNYNIGEVVKIVAEGKDFEAIMDIGRRYPLLMNKVTKLVTLAGETASDFFSYMPEYLTANKVNKMIKDAVIDEDAEEAEDTEEKDIPESEKKTKKSKKAKKEVEDDEEEADDAEDEDNPYSGKTAPELYKECKKRGIKVAAKKDAKYYEKALLKADAETEEAEEDWEEEKPAKPAKKEKAAKKKAKKEEEEVEEDEDWDI